MNGARRMPALLLAAWIVAMPAALAQDSERNRYFVQQMIEMAATNNEQGVAGMQRMLEQNPRPAASDPAARAPPFSVAWPCLGRMRWMRRWRHSSRPAGTIPVTPTPPTIWGWSTARWAAFPKRKPPCNRRSLEPTRAVAWFQLAQVYGLTNDADRALGALANTYRFAQNQMRAEEILRNIAENRGGRHPAQRRPGNPAAVPPAGGSRHRPAAAGQPPTVSCR